MFEQPPIEIETFLRQHFDARSQNANPQYKIIFDSVSYSVFTGGKRFRPWLSLLTADLLKMPRPFVLPWACAIELIHTYSLIHDDLPCLDNDDERRGQPTNHIKFGEALALLAGDGLQSEAFFILAKTPVVESLPKLVSLLADGAGLGGMLSGQVMDIRADGKYSKADVLELHRLKTGALIRLSAEGVGAMFDSLHAGAHLQKLVSEMGAHIGLAFQIADDLLDHDPDHPEIAGLPRVIGVDGTKDLLSSVSLQAQKCLDQIHKQMKDQSIEGLSGAPELKLANSNIESQSNSDNHDSDLAYKKLSDLIRFNQTRSK
jgi:geranylgeranyl diphosphate synthase type II